MRRNEKMTDGTGAAEHLICFEVLSCSPDASIDRRHKAGALSHRHQPGVPGLGRSDETASNKSMGLLLACE